MRDQPIRVNSQTRTTVHDAMNVSLHRFCGDECGGWCESPVDYLDAGEMGHFVPVPRVDQVALLEIVDALHGEGRDTWVLPATPYLTDLLIGQGERLAESIAYSPSERVFVDGELEHLHACRGLLSAALDGGAAG